MCINACDGLRRASALCNEAKTAVQGPKKPMQPLILDLNITHLHVMCGHLWFSWPCRTFSWSHAVSLAFGHPTPACCRQVWRRWMLCLSQFLNADVQKKGAQSGSRQLLPLSMPKNRYKKWKRQLRKTGFWSQKRGVGRWLTSNFFIEIERKHAQWTPHGMAP